VRACKNCICLSITYDLKSLRLLIGVCKCVYTCLPVAFTEANLHTICPRLDEDSFYQLLTELPAPASLISAILGNSSGMSLQMQWSTWLQLWSSADWTIATQCLPVYRVQNSVHYSESPEHCSSSPAGPVTTLPRLSGINGAALVAIILPHPAQTYPPDTQGTLQPVSFIHQRFSNANHSGFISSSTMRHQHHL